jgi:tetratricopeptide (TPR) repeat protein
MVHAFVLTVGLRLLAGDAIQMAEKARRAEYQVASARAGKTADAQIQLALWCEAHGLSPERLKHLELAVLFDPKSALARGLLGLVSYHGKWASPEDAIRSEGDDPARQALTSEYLARRVKTANKADAQLRLAAWCDLNGLKDQAIAHYNEVIRLDPAHQAAWRHLGYKKAGSRWVKPDELAAEKRAAEQQKRADRIWKPKLERLRDFLLSKDSARRAKAREELAAVTDPAALPMIWTVFLRGNETVQLAAVQVLAQIEGASASNALAVLAVFNQSPAVRQRAAESLLRRDPRDVVGRLIGLVRKPFKYRFTPPKGPGTSGELFVEGERFNVDRFYNNLPVNPGWIVQRMFAPSVAFDPYNVQNMMLAAVAANPQAYAVTTAPQAGRAGHAATAATPTPGVAVDLTANPFFWFQAMAAQRDQMIAERIEIMRRDQATLEQRQARDIQVIESTNKSITLVNSRVLPLLTAICGKDLGVEPEKWKTWWTDQLGYVYQGASESTKPTYTDFVAVGTLVEPTHSACFAAGTLVKTIDGPRSIESIRVGDRVLAQNPSTGALSFQPVLTVHRNEPAPTLGIAVGGETIVATGIHRFWKTGKGWTMARALKPGDTLRMVGGAIDVQSIKTGPTQPVYNLDVADCRDFFVGTTGLLVHDFSFVQPVAQPFDRPAAPAASAPRDAGAATSTP